MQCIQNGEEKLIFINIHSDSSDMECCEYKNRKIAEPGSARLIVKPRSACLIVEPGSACMRIFVAGV